MTLGKKVWLTVASIPAAVMIHDNIVGFGLVKDNTMAPTLSLPAPNAPEYETKQVVLVAKRWSGVGNDFEPGDVVQIQSPTLPGQNQFVRVISLDGIVETRQGHLLRVPKGMTWVESDVPDVKVGDSVTYGPIPRYLVQGKALAVVWPPKFMRTIPSEYPADRVRFDKPFVQGKPQDPPTLPPLPVRKPTAVQQP